MTKSESLRVGYYETLSIDRTKKNLAEFNDKVIYHQGYIPESFSASPEPPRSIIFLHIDLNAAKSTIDALNFFLPRLSKRGIVLFDDYGHLSFKDTKKEENIAKKELSHEPVEESVAEEKKPAEEKSESTASEAEKTKDETKS